MKAYKLTNENMQTFNKTQWVMHEWKETSGKGDLCSKGWLHYYSDPPLAAFLNPMHAKFDMPRLFEIEVAVDAQIKADHGLKFGCTKMRLVQELQFVQPTKEQCIKFGILCALEVCKDKRFIKWANNWLDGTDRSEKAAGAAARAAGDAAYWAARAAARAAAWDAMAAAGAAAWDAALAAGDAAWAAARAAEVAAWAAGDAKEKIDLVALAAKAMER